MKLTAKTFPPGNELSWAFNITDDDGRVLVRGEMPAGATVSTLVFQPSGWSVVVSAKMLKAIDIAMQFLERPSASMV